MITIDMSIARDIWRKKIRSERKEKLKELDVEYQRADEENSASKKDKVAKQKKKLRDAPAAPEIEAANTPEELKAFWPFD